MLKDISYALAMAKDAGIVAEGAERSEGLLRCAIESGLGEKYWPVILTIIDGTAEVSRPRTAVAPT